MFAKNPVLNYLKYDKSLYSKILEIKIGSFN